MLSRLFSILAVLPFAAALAVVPPKSPPESKQTVPSSEITRRNRIHVIRGLSAELPLPAGAAVEFVYTPDHGKLTRSGRQWVFTADLIDPDTDEILYKLRHSSGVTESGAIEIEIIKAHRDEELKVEEGKTTPLPLNNRGSRKLLEPPSSGTLKQSARGWTYHYNPGGFAADEFTYALYRGGKLVDVRTLPIAIVPEPQPPTVDPTLTYTVQMNRWVDFSFNPNASPTEEMPTFTIVTRPRHGVLRRYGRDFVYTPERGFTGDDTLLYYATNRKGRSNVGKVVFEVENFHFSPNLSPPSEVRFSVPTKNAP